MPILETLFWTSLLLAVYTYAGYGVLIFLLSRLYTPKALLPTYTPSITLLIAAYNEEDCIAEKLRNSLSLDYPPEKLQVWVVADGSSDNTTQIISQFTGVQVFFQPERRGKIHAVNRVMPLVKSELTIYSDANTTLNPEALQQLARHFADPRVGVVAGEKRVLDANGTATSGEGMYWKYESALKAWDARFYSAVGAAGELFAIRTSLFTPVESDTLIEDFVMSMRIAAQGYRIAYEPQAYACEYGSATITEEMKRKVRIAAGGIQAVVRLSALLNPLRYGRLSFCYISHRVLRWTLTPLSLPLLLMSNLLLLALSPTPLYLLTALGQAAFYLLALWGETRKDRPALFPGFFLPYYFYMMNLCVYKGFLVYMQKRQSVVWEKAQRAKAPEA